MSSPIVFISYSHDSEDHQERVLGLSERLHKDGIESVLDQYVNGSPAEGWPRWMMNQLDRASHVLVVCTATYYRRFRGHEEPGKGKGADWEGALIANDLYQARSRSLKFVPVFLSAPDEQCIPDPLRGATYYAVTSDDGYQSLYDFLLQQSGVEPGPIGESKTKPRAKGTPLSFDSPAPQKPRIDVDRIIKYAPEELVGRAEETQLLDQAWAKVQSGEKPRPHVFTFVAWGGEGKTSVVAKWVADLAAKDCPGCEAAFGWTFYSQGTRDQAASSDFFLNEALRFFDDEATAASAKGAHEKGKRLAELVGQRKALLVLDGIEPLQYPPAPPMEGALKDQGVSALLKGLAAQSQGLCIVTTRCSVPDLKAYRQGTAPEHKLERLSEAAGVELLRKLGVTGPDKELASLVGDVNGHALTLQIFGAFLRKARHGDIRCRDRVKLDKADAAIQGGHAFRAMAAYAKWMEGESDEARRELAILRLLGLFDRPATADCLEALLNPPAIPGLTEHLTGLGEDDLSFSIDSLQSAKLVTANRENGSGRLICLDAHPLLREYFGKCLREDRPEAWKESHRRLYQHLCETSKEGEAPTLEDLQPLYQAVAHGCEAGLQREACLDIYERRILQGGKHYTWHKLGAYGSELRAQACFFETPWSRVSPTLTGADRVWLQNEVGVVLYALGRLAEALEPMSAGLQIEIERGDWENAARRAQNLSDLELTLGDVTKAQECSQNAVNYADLSGRALERSDCQAAYAHALHCAGHRAEAEALFQVAEQMHTTSEPDYPLLYGVLGFNYCDLLLVDAEREAWKPDGTGKQDTILRLCRTVSQRARQTLKWPTTVGVPLPIALDHLTLGRTALYAAILESRGRAPAQRVLKPAATELDLAVSGLHRAGTQHYLPRGLLTGAWLRAITGPRTGLNSAQSDLDEAWEIAERGPMPLFLADIHLYRARLFFGEPSYPWHSPQHDLAEARRLIFKHGYLRRKEELEDAEAAILKHRAG